MSIQPWRRYAVNLPWGRYAVNYPQSANEDNGTTPPIIININYPCSPEQEKSVCIDSNPTKKINVGKMANPETYITAAFRSSYRNEAYLFMRNEYVLLNYAPGSTNDRVLNGPLLISDGYPSLAGTVFGEYGIDCAFASHYNNEAFIFNENQCAHIDYAPHSKNDEIIRGPMTITAMFPFFKGTGFESGIDAAFESTRTNQAYLFRGHLYALIDYARSRLIAIRSISEGFPSLKNTIFANDIDAAFASHRTNEAYLFKGDHYARINFAPGTSFDYIMGGIKKILPNWPSLQSILPRK